MTSPGDPFEEAAGALESIGDVVRFAVTRFGAARLAFGHGFADARSEACYLLAWALHLPHADFERYLDARLAPAELAESLALLRRRVEERIPAAYLTREAWLGEYRFYVDERTLVPRSFIAELLRERLAPWVADPDAVRSVLDLCTGSGCLAILAADAFPNALVDAADISPDALEVARRNIADYALADRVRPVRSDAFSGLSSRRYDVIVCNPPYVRSDAMATLPREYLHEPGIGLAGGEDGLDFVRRLVGAAHAHLEQGGCLVVEIGHNRDAVEAAFPGLPFTWLETTSGGDFVFLLTREQLPA
jgi:ribosomal protein L3 glutamine methyltransferase